MTDLVPSRPELLAPAGDWDCVRAAIENGADAVYFGLDTGFNARARAKNFDVADLPRLMSELHRRGLKGYVTLNTLAFTSELPEVEKLVRQIASAGVDAVLVQDLGLVRLIRAICPDLEIHASTQMTLTSSQTIAAAAELGVNRVVLARECSLGEIRRIRSETTMPLEVFVHGALCVAYSGQCLTSESLGGRSANRGQCAQACRLPYDLVCDGQDIDLGEQKYLLSPQDLAAYDLIPQLIEAGVCSFKIEGRLKTPEYVANITRHYRQAIDSALAGQPVQFTSRDVEEMELSFSRGFSPGWLGGCDHKMLVPATSSSKRGVLLGHVRGVRKNRVVVELADRAVKPGDGVSFDCGRPVDDEQGGRVYEVFVGRASSRPSVELTFAHGAIDFTQIQPGMRVWKTDDPELTNRLRKTFTNADPQRRTAIDLSIHAATGQPLTIHATTETGLTCELSSDEPCQEARQHPLTEQTLRDQLGRLGGTPFMLRSLTAQIDSRPMLPFSLLGRLRHDLVEQLEKLSTAPSTRRITAESALPGLRDFTALNFEPGALNSALAILSRSLPQLREVLAAGIKNIYADFADIREYRDAVKLAHEHQATIFLATPRIQKPDELGIFHALAKHGADGILVRNLSGLRFFRERQTPVIADFSLNAANELTAHYLIEQGANYVTPSYDLNRDQLLDLVAAVPPQWLEVVVHQHMPMFHMEHCVFCAVLSPGTNKHNCGRPCDVHQVKLRDRLGIEHPLTADVGCRNTLFNAVPQSGAEIVPQLLASGVRRFRIELLDDHGQPLLDLLRLYQHLLSGDITGKEVWTRLKATNRVGVTRGTLEERRHPLAIVQIPPAGWDLALLDANHQPTDHRIANTQIIEVNMIHRTSISSWIVAAMLFALPMRADELKPGVRGLATRAPATMKIDGDLSEFHGAFCTPVNYFQLQKPALLKDRPAQFFYMWDDTAFYAGLRTLDTRQFNGSDDAHLWGGDAVEWYFDTRRGENFRGIDWGKGAVHMYWTGYDKAELKPRWCLRPGYLEAIPGKGIEVAARKTRDGAEIEFKLPWENFPDFKPAMNETIALDAELCYSDGAARIDRIFAYGSPLCVQQPAAQGIIQLVDKLEPVHWKQCSAVLAPIRCDTAWTQKTKAYSAGQIALPPDHADQIGKIAFRISDLEGKTVGEYAAERSTINEPGKFYLAEAHWPADIAPPGQHTVIAILTDKSGKELCRIAPRLVSAGWLQGY